VPFKKKLDGGEWSASCPGRFTPRERAPDTHWIGGGLGPRIVLDGVMRQIPSSPEESNPRTLIVQPVVQSYIRRIISEIEAIAFSETLINISQITQRINPEDQHLIV
jgi:hypothetical protein